MYRILRDGLGVVLAGMAFAGAIVLPAGAGQRPQLAASQDCAYGVPVQVMPGQAALAYAASIQEELNVRGYNAGPIDGIVGTKTRRAIRRYQRDYGLVVDGCATRELLEHLKFVAPRPYSGQNRAAGRQYAHREPAPSYDSWGDQPAYVPVPYASYAPAPPPLYDSRSQAPYQASPPSVYSQSGQAVPFGAPPQTYDRPPQQTYSPPPQQTYDAPTQQAYNAPAQTYEPPPPQYDPYGPPSRSLVMEIQQELYLRGYYGGAIDGVAGAGTQTAAERFRSDAGYPPSREIDQALLNQLRQADDSIRY